MSLESPIYVLSESCFCFSKLRILAGKTTKKLQHSIQFLNFRPLVGNSRCCWLGFGYQCCLEVSWQCHPHHHHHPKDGSMSHWSPSNKTKTNRKLRKLRAWTYPLKWRLLESTFTHSSKTIPQTHCSNKTLPNIEYSFAHYYKASFHSNNLQGSQKCFDDNPSNVSSSVVCVLSMPKSLPPCCQDSVFTLEGLSDVISLREVMEWVSIFLPP